MILFEPSALNPKPGFCQSMSPSWGKDLLGNEGGERGDDYPAQKTPISLQVHLDLIPKNT